MAVTYTVPSGTPNAVYTLAAVGATSNAVALTQFTVGTPQLNTQVNAYDWPNFGYDLQGTRVNPTETTINTGNVSTLAVKWKSPFPVSNRVTGSPMIVNGIAYVGTNRVSWWPLTSRMEIPSGPSQQMVRSMDRQQYKMVLRTLAPSTILLGDQSAIICMQLMRPMGR